MKFGEANDGQIEDRSAGNQKAGCRRAQVFQEEALQVPKVVFSNIATDDDRADALRENKSCSRNAVTARIFGCRGIQGEDAAKTRVIWPIEQISG